MRYFFDILDNADRTVDQVGVDLSDPDEARLQATLALTEMAHDYLPANGYKRCFSIQVRTDVGPVFGVSLNFEIKEAGRPGSQSVSIP